MLGVRPVCVWCVYVVGVVGLAVVLFAMMLVVVMMRGVVEGLGRS